MVLAWWKQLINRQTERQRRSVRAVLPTRTQLSLEVLEERSLLSTTYPMHPETARQVRRRAGS